MYVHVEIYVDDDALDEWLKDNDYDPYMEEDLDLLTYYINENQPMVGQVVKVV